MMRRHSCSCCSPQSDKQTKQTPKIPFDAPAACFRGAAFVHEMFQDGRISSVEYEVLRQAIWPFDPATWESLVQIKSPPIPSPSQLDHMRLRKPDNPGLVRAGEDHGDLEFPGPPVTFVIEGDEISSRLFHHHGFQTDIKHCHVSAGWVRSLSVGLTGRFSQGNDRQASADRLSDAFERENAVGQ